MQAHHHRIQVPRTAHYYTLGEDIHKARHIWLLIHGYGQLASRMIGKFSNSDATNNYFIAPEAFSKHYVRRQPNYVGASWMTQEHRLDEIADYVNYLTELMNPIIENLQEHQKLNILGFSQGTSTMWRWINHSKINFHSIIHWAGEFPKEMDFESMSPYLNKIKHKYFCLGNKDEYITEDHKVLIQSFVKENHLNMKFKFFEGTHVIDQPTFKSINAEIQ